jgi:recombination protein RecA
MPPKEKAKASIADILEKSAKKYADKFSIGFETDVRFLDTGNIALNDIMGGGVPVGRITQFYGKSQSGKTTAALQTAALVQKRILEEESDDVILYMDYECALDETYAGNLGLDIHDDSFVMIRPQDFEAGANLARELINSGKVALMVWDSVAAAVPSAMFDEELGKAAVAPLARLMSAFLAQLNPILLNTDTAAIFINHVHSAIGGMPGFGPPQKVRPGGEKLTYYSSVMVEFIAMTKEKGDIVNIYGEKVEVPVATETKMVCTKNKVGVPQREGRALVRYGIGFDNLWSAKKILEFNGLIKTAGAWIRIDDSLGGDTLNGTKAFAAKAKEDPTWRQMLIDSASAILEKDRLDKSRGSSVASED